jgi:hypothetical protein
MSVTPNSTVPPKTPAPETVTPPLAEETHAERIKRILSSDEPLTLEEFDLLMDELADNTEQFANGAVFNVTDESISRERLYEGRG